MAAKPVLSRLVVCEEEIRRTNLSLRKNIFHLSITYQQTHNIVKCQAVQTSFTCQQPTNKPTTFSSNYHEMLQVFHLSRQSWLATAWQTPAIQRQPHNWIFHRFFDVILIHNRNFTNTWKFLHNILLFVRVCVCPLLVHDKGLHNFTLIWSWCYS